MSVGSSDIELRMVKDRWVLTGDPYVLHRAEQAVPFATRHSNNSLSWEATEENAVELMWLKQRFGYHCRHEMILRRDAAKHNLRAIETRKVLNGKYEPGSVQFRDGVEPRDYQKTAAMLWRTSKNLLLADTVGVGKTISTIAGFADAEMLPAVVIAPSNLTIQWQGQIERCLPSLSSHLISREKNYDLSVVATCCNCGEAVTYKAAALKRCSYCKGTQFERRVADVYMISYTLASKWQHALGGVVKSLVLDECQEIRRTDSKKYEAVKEISSKAKFRIGLSATPVQNYGGEMFNIMNVLNPGKLGTKTKFNSTWCEYTKQGSEPSLKDPEAFGKYLMDQGWMLRRTREDVGRELPPEQRIIHTIDFDADVFSKLTKDAKELARVIMRLNETQLASTDPFGASAQFRAMLYKATGVAKAPYVAQFVKLLLEGGEPVMLFGFHRDCYATWDRILKDYKPILYSGSETPKEKERNKQAFMSGESNLLMCSLKSGVGLDGIQDRCKVGVIGELDWSPAVLTQCIGRYHRDGQADPCLTYVMVSDAGCDPYMMQTLGIKRLQVDGVVLQDEESSVMDSIDTANHLRELAAKFLAA